VIFGGCFNAELTVKTDHLDFSEIMDAQKDAGLGDGSPGPAQRQSMDKSFRGTLISPTAPWRWKTFT
jgi:hypothetical protein